MEKGCSFQHHELPMQIIILREWWIKQSHKIISCPAYKLANKLSTQESISTQECTPAVLHLDSRLETKLKGNDFIKIKILTSPGQRK